MATCKYGCLKSDYVAAKMEEWNGEQNIGRWQQYHLVVIFDLYLGFLFHFHGSNFYFSIRRPLVLPFCSLRLPDYVLSVPGSQWPQLTMWASCLPKAWGLGSQKPVSDFFSRLQAVISTYYMMSHKVFRGDSSSCLCEWDIRKAYGKGDSKFSVRACRLGHRCSGMVFPFSAKYITVSITPADDATQPATSLRATPLEESTVDATLPLKDYDLCRIIMLVKSKEMMNATFHWVVFWRVFFPLM